MDGSPNTDPSAKRSFFRRHTFRWASKTQKAFVYDLANPERVTEEEVNEENKAASVLVFPLPRWRNEVHVFQDANEMEHVDTLECNHCGFIKNCKRRLGINYKVLHVKGRKQDYQWFGWSEEVSAWPLASEEDQIGGYLILERATGYEKNGKAIDLSTVQRKQSKRILAFSELSKCI